MVKLLAKLLNITQKKRWLKAKKLKISIYKVGCEIWLFWQKSIKLVNKGPTMKHISILIANICSFICCGGTMRFQLSLKVEFKKKENNHIFDHKLA